MKRVIGDDLVEFIGFVSTSFAKIASIGNNGSAMFFLGVCTCFVILVKFHPTFRSMLELADKTTQKRIDELREDISLKDKRIHALHALKDGLVAKVTSSLQKCTVKDKKKHCGLGIDLFSEIKDGGSCEGK